MKRFTCLLLALMLVVPAVGCKKATPTNPVILAPGAVSQFDEQSYAVLSASQATLDSLKASDVPAIKTALNDAILAYNTAEAAYQVYHAAAVAGQNPATAPVSTALSNLQTKITAVQTAALGAK